MVTHGCFLVSSLFVGLVSGKGAVWLRCGFTLSSQFIKRLLSPPAPAFLIFFAAFVINSFTNHFKKVSPVMLKTL